ncbi:MAG: PAS domain S-box protein [Proteobacteria bacterium]|nr:PAS domain S-box protein [Pseudomonadota bacterium]MBU4294770.1 PAS domain S-box protein [Pseudomonadota bacterium]MCG2749816.1 PAS domain S-box protein [Desulfobulbaceae bacterium]
MKKHEKNNREGHPRQPPQKLLGRLAYLVRYSPNTLIITDTDGTIEYVNTVFTSITGHQYEDVIGHHLDDFNLHDKQSMPGFSLAAIRRGDVWQGEITSYTKDGTSFYEQVSVLPITDENDRICWIAFIKQNISKTKRVEEELRTLTQTLEEQIRDQKATEIELAVLNRQNELILNSVAEGIFGVDVEGSITFVNATAEKLTGYRSDEVFGIPYRVFFQPKSVDGVRFDPRPCPISASFKDGMTHRSSQEVFAREDGSSFPVRLVSAPIIEDETVIGAVVLFEDITDELRIQREKQKAEQQLRELTATLDERVQKRTAQLNAINIDLLNTLNQLQKTQAQLVQSEKMASLGGLVAGVAHEINTPVGIAFTAATHLDKETAEVLKLYRSGKMKRSDLDEYLDTCRESTALLQSNLNRAGELIRSFKQVAIDQTGEAKRTFNLGEYIDEVLLSLRPMLKKTRHAVEVICDEKISLCSYPGAFSQILTNLMTNSLTHAYAEGEAGRIRLFFSQTPDNLTLDFSDDGKGIATNDLPRIFEPFFTTNRKMGGSGLGLHIIYNIITQKLNGAIICRSEPGKGTTFVVNIPLV